MPDAGGGASLTFSATAAEPLDAFVACVLCDDGVYLSTSSAGEGVIAISQDRVSAGDVVALCFSGVSKWQSDSLFSVGDLLAADSNGCAVALIESVAQPLGIAVGTALTPSTELGTVVYALLNARPQPFFVSGQQDRLAEWWKAS
jgi:hypothetical protein